MPLDLESPTTPPNRSPSEEIDFPTPECFQDVWDLMVMLNGRTPSGDNPDDMFLLEHGLKMDEGNAKVAVLELRINQMRVEAMRRERGTREGRVVKGRRRKFVGVEKVKKGWGEQSGEEGVGEPGTPSPK